jgi:F-type H+-transporting ATPase subunit a
MSGFDIVATDQWLLGPLFGIDHSFLRINKETVIHTWITLAVIAALLFLGRYFLSKKDSLGQFITLNFISFFVDLINQTLTEFSMNHFIFVTTTFCFVLGCNVISLIPWMEEPTTDLNTTLALGLVSFFYTQWAAIQVYGLWEYIKGYFSPFFIMMPLNVVGKLATVVSISFRLFGNIFGGSIISSIYFQAIQGNFILEILGLATGVNLVITVFFGLFEGFLQAFVFGMLSLTYLSLALQGEGH